MELFDLCFVLLFHVFSLSLRSFVFHLTVTSFTLCGIVHILIEELSYSSCATVTHGACNVSSSFRSWFSTLLFPFESLKTHSRLYVVWTVSKSSITFVHFLNRTVLPFLCNCYIRLLYLSAIVSSGHSNLLLSFESLLTHSHNYTVWTAAHLFFIPFLNGAVLLFLGNCYARSVKHIYIAPKWTLPLLFPFELLIIRSHNCVAWAFKNFQPLFQWTYAVFLMWMLHMFHIKWLTRHCLTFTQSFTERLHGFCLNPLYWDYVNTSAVWNRA